MMGEGEFQVMTGTPWRTLKEKLTLLLAVNGSNSFAVALAPTLTGPALLNESVMLVLNDCPVEREPLQRKLFVPFTGLQPAGGVTTVAFEGAMIVPWPLVAVNGP